MDSVEQKEGFSVEVSQAKTRKINLIVYSSAVALFWTSLYLYVPTLPVYVNERVNSLSAVGLILAMYGLWQAIIRFPLGIASDRLGLRKPFILSGFFLSILGALVMGLSNTGWGLGRKSVV